VVANIPVLAARLSVRKVSLNELLLDPNNPRLLGERSGQQPIPEEKLADDSVQNTSLELMKKEKFGVKDLRNSILQIGYLPFDRIVVRKARNEKYVVIEGNRRVAALKWLKESADAGELDLPKELQELIKSMEVFELQTDAESLDSDRSIVQGVRHISGVKEWGAYEKALAVRTFVEDLGYSIRETAEALGTTTHEVNKLYRALGAFQQMQKDGDYEEYANPNIFSYFVETVGKPALRAFLVWDEATRTLTDDENRSRFYSWIIPNEDGIRKIPMAIDTRKLAAVVQSERALRVLDAEGGTIDAAFAATEKAVTYDWREPVLSAFAALDNIPASVLEEAKDEDLKLIQDLIELASRRIQQFKDHHA